MVSPSYARVAQPTGHRHTFKARADSLGDSFRHHNMVKIKLTTNL